MKKKMIKMSLALFAAFGLVILTATLIPKNYDAGETVTLPVIQVCSHTYVEKVDAKYLKSPRDFEHGDIYYKSCSKCGKKHSTETFEVGDPYIYGDVDGNGKIEARDVGRLAKYIANYNEKTGTSTVEISPGADVDGNGKIEARDVGRLAKYIANYNEKTGTSSVTLGPTKSN